MIKVTLDHNCIIALEKAEDSAPYIRGLIKMNEETNISLQVVAVGASEEMLNGRHISNFSEFKERLAAVSLDHVTILRPIAYWGISFFDWCLWGDGPNGPMKTLEREIHKILFPEVEFEYGDFCKARNLNPKSNELDSKWRNPKCDVLTLWSHIYHKGDIFVTSDKCFHKVNNKPELIKLGAGDVLTPEDAVSRLTSSRSTS